MTNSPAFDADLALTTQIKTLQTSLNLFEGNQENLHSALKVLCTRFHDSPDDRYSYSFQKIPFTKKYEFKLLNTTFIHVEIVCDSYLSGVIKFTLFSPQANCYYTLIPWSKIISKGEWIIELEKTLKYLLSTLTENKITDLNLIKHTL